MNNFTNISCDTTTLKKSTYKYIVLSESNHYGWGGDFTTLVKTKKLLKIETEIFYIFKYVHKKTEVFQMKIRYPIDVYYDCLSINEYTEEVFEEDDDYVIITLDDTDSLILTHKPYKENVEEDDLVALLK